MKEKEGTIAGADLKLVCQVGLCKQMLKQNLGCRVLIRNQYL